MGGFYSDRAFVVENNRIGYIDKSGAIVINPQFDSTSDYGISGSRFYDDGYAIVRTGNLYGVIDTSGKYVINPQFSDYSVKSYIKQVY